MRLISSPTKMSNTVIFVLLALLFEPMLVACGEQRNDADSCLQVAEEDHSACIDGVLPGGQQLSIGMPVSDAFAVACEMQRMGQLRAYPVLYTAGQRRAFPDTSICDIGDLAVAADEWELMVQSGWRDQYLIVTFEDGAVSEIERQNRGLDP